MKGQKGITLVALIITIIVMLILVAVSIAVVINSGLLDSASRASKETKNAIEEEANLDGVNINGVYYNTVEEYVNVLMNGTV